MLVCHLMINKQWGSQLSLEEVAVTMTTKTNQIALDEQKRVTTKKQNTLDPALPVTDTVPTATVHTDIARGTLKPSQVPALQRTIGNQAVNRLIQRQQRKPVTQRKSNLSFLQRKPMRTSAAEKLEEEKPKAPVTVRQQPHGAQPSVPNVQRLWQDTGMLGEYEWDMPIKTPGHDDQTWHFDEELNKLWYEVPHSSSDIGRNSQYAGQSNARSVGGWKKIGLGKLMKEIDPTTLKNFPLEAQETYPYGPGIDLDKIQSNPKSAKKSRLVNDESGFLMKGTVYDETTGHHSRKDKTANFQGEKMRTQEFDWATYTSTVHERSKRMNFASGSESEAKNAKGYVEQLNLQELDYLKTIPDVDLAGVVDYTGGSYEKMNANLRSGGAMRKNKIAASGLHQLPPVVGTVYRGVGLSLENLRDMGYLNVGGTLTKKGFVSTTIDRRYWKAGKFGGGKVGLQFESKGGAKDIKMISGMSGEDEKLFAPHTVFKVKGYTPLDEIMTADNIEDISHTPTVTTTAPLPPSTQAVVVYLEEQPTIQQKTKYEELGRKWGTVNIDKATEIANLLRPLWLSIAQEYNLDTTDYSLISQTVSYTALFYRGVLTAIKKIATDTDLADDVIDALKSGGYAGLASLPKNQLIENLRDRWATLADETNRQVSEVEEQRRLAEKEKRNQQAKKAAHTAKNIQLFQQIVSDTTVMDAIDQWYNNPSNNLAKAKGEIKKIINNHGHNIKAGAMKKFLTYISR